MDLGLFSDVLLHKLCNKILNIKSLDTCKTEEKFCFAPCIGALGMSEYYLIH